MSSSPSSSSSESFSPSKSPSSLANFDPFAVHPFTNCSQVNQGSGPTYNPANSTYGYALTPNVTSQSRNAPQVPSSATTNGTPGSTSRVPATPYGKDDALKSRTGTPSKPIPIASARKY